MVFKISRKTFTLLAIGLMAGLSVLSQTAYAQGESAVPFILIAPNARADGMGEAGVGLADDASASFWNPAGLAFLRGQEVSLTHSNWLPAFQQADLFYEYLSYRNYIDDWGGSVSASVTYLSLGEFVYTGPGGPDDIRGTFKAYEMAVTGGYSTNLTDNFALGLNLRYIHSVLAPLVTVGASGTSDREGIGSSASFDIAGLWKVSPALNIGVNLSNLGPKITYIDAEQADPLPTMLRVGFAYKPIESEYNNVTLIADFSRLLVRRYSIADSLIDPVTHRPYNNSPLVDNLPKSLISAWGDKGLAKVDIAGGIEYWYGKPKLLALRFGYFYERPEAGNRKFMTFGAGIRYDVYGFDFSYLSAIEENNPLAETLRFTLLINWGGPPQE